MNCSASPCRQARSQSPVPTLGGSDVAVGVAAGATAINTLAAIRTPAAATVYLFIVPPQGKANTHTAEPRFGGLRNSGTSGAKLRAWNPPSPTTSAMYCLPFTAKVIGLELETSFRRACQSSLPLALS